MTVCMGLSDLHIKHLNMHHKCKYRLKLSVKIISVHQTFYTHFYLEISVTCLDCVYIHALIIDSLITFSGNYS